MQKTMRRRVAEILEVGKKNDRLSRGVDYFLVALILFNVIAIVLESEPGIHGQYEEPFFWFESVSVAIFSIEYVLRVWSCLDLRSVDSATPIRSRIRFMLKPMLVIDLLAILPFFLTLFFVLDLRFLRIVRLLRIFKLTRYSHAMKTMLEVLEEELPALAAAAFILLVLLVMASSGIYLIEHKVQPDAFGSIPAAMWWAMVTLTTVGYGDVTPVTVGGKFFGALVTLVGVGMVALPTGILASGFANAFRRRRIRYEQQVRFALEDGVVTTSEVQLLQQLQEKLGISKEDAETIMRLSMKEKRHEKHQCPHCGGLFSTRDMLDKNHGV